MKYSYKTIRKCVDIPYDGGERDADTAIDEYLNSIGDDGWELINYDIVVDYSNRKSQVSIYGIAKREQLKNSCLNPILDTLLQDDANEEKTSINE